MKFLDFKRGQDGQEWGLLLFGQPVIRKLVRYKMQCNEVRVCCEIPDDIQIRTMDLDSIKLVDKMRYQVGRYFKKYRDVFYGVVAYKEGEPCGYVCGRKVFRNKNAEDYFYIAYVFIDQRFRGMHISMILIQELSRMVNYPLILNCGVNNGPAFNIYTKIGFKRISKSETLYIPALAKHVTLRSYDIMDGDLSCTR